MNFFKYLDANGTQKVGSFCSDWNEVPFDKFLAWDVLLQKMSSIKKEIDEIGFNAAEKHRQLTFVNESLEACNKNGQSAGDEILQEKDNIYKQRDALIAKYEHLKESVLKPLEIEAISLFTDVSPLSLALMPKGKDIDIEGINLEVLQDVKDTNIEYLTILLYALVNKPLPTNVFSKFQWQIATDDEIERIESDLQKQSFISKYFGKGKELRNKLSAAVKGEFEIKDIWKHTTYANSQFQKSANAIVADMQLGKWDNVPALISMLLVETDTNEKVLKELQGHGSGSDKSTKEYLELYAAAYKKVFERNQVLFFGQKQKLTVAHIIGIRNFFLHSREK